MKTIQFILSVLFISLLASCSAENDVLNEIEDHNQLPSDEKVTVTLDLSATVSTRSEAAEIDPEKAITSYIVKVFGDQNVLLATLVGSKDDLAQKTLNIKKQNLTIYAIANFSNEDFEKATTIIECDKFIPENIDNNAFGETKAFKMPKSSNKITIEKGSCSGTLTVPLVQLTARIEKPVVYTENNVGNYTFISLTIGGDVLKSFPAYIYPGKKEITLIATSTLDKNDYSFSAEARDFVANTIYAPTLTPNDPQTSGGLWIDWYVAPMLSQDITAEVGGNN